MEWPDDLAAALPEPLPDEPADLRRDLLDEIADHLQCAARRELLANVDEETVRKRILERFGDPRRVLRQLWFEAMKEKLVTQRITMVAGVVLAVASMVACGVAWSAASGVQEANRQLLAASEETHAAIVALVNRDRPEAVTSVRSPEWNPFGVELVDAENGEPLEGWTVEVSGHLHGDTEEATLVETTDSSGQVDIGMVRPGTHHLRITAPWGEQRTNGVVVKPGMDGLARFKCPGNPPPATSVSLSYVFEGWDAWPDERLGMILSIGREPRQVAQGHWHDPERRTIVMTRSGMHVVESNTFGDGIILTAEPRPVSERQLELQEGTYSVARVRFLEVPEDGVLKAHTGLRLLNFPYSTGVPARDLAIRAGMSWQPEFVADVSVPNSEWRSTVPTGLITKALAGLSVIQLGRESSDADYAKAVEFHSADANHDGTLTAAEYDAATPSVDGKKPSETLGLDWPMNVGQFLR